MLLLLFGAAALLWGGCGAHRIAPRMVGGCSSDGECGAGATCDGGHVCRCTEHGAVHAPGGCLQGGASVGGPCVHSVQCPGNSSCEGQSCVCDSGFWANASLCAPNDGSEVPRGAAVDQNMVIVLAVLAIMFVGICVALHLFSKARFRNRRTIFNSPHPRLMHIKLGKRKKSSIHHLPPPPPHPSAQGRHHSFSGHHSPYPQTTVPKTRSHECLRSSLSREASPRFQHRPRTAPLAERESMPPSSEELDKKSPEPLHNGPLLEEDPPRAPGSPTVIITDADGAHTVVTSARPASSAADV
ncbi:hypothetical protein JTE90_006124 [Oedothorax gibbosus]|uniref:EB domain-containing protein n=1 Tax=Oedothorax gibbosus TaxID=931172 RepID=A0AAV6V3V1_9ARAC|nr:hypothetical protein JTE90_006124 [Oedothorax gibbosus]